MDCKPVVSKALGLALALSGVWSTQAAAFPDRPITIIVPFTAGGGVDINTRRYADLVSKTIGQRVVVENRTGGGGIVGALAVKQSKPDGHTLYLAHAGTHAIMQAMQTDLPFDPVKDFKPVSLLFYFPHVLGVADRVPAKTAAELVAYGKTKPGGLSYGSQSIASPAHLLGEMFAIESKTSMTHIPYPGGAPMNLDLAAGRLDYGFGTYNGFGEFWRSGKVRFLATASERRARTLPDLPTMAEAGYPGLDLVAWFGLVAPAGTPDSVVKKLTEEFANAAKDKGLIEAFDRQGYEGVPEGPEPFAALMAKDTDRMGKIIKALGIKAN